MVEPFGLIVPFQAAGVTIESWPVGVWLPLHNLRDASDRWGWSTAPPSR